jgi:hypothetical protein
MWAPLSGGHAEAYLVDVGESTGTGQAAPEPNAEEPGRAFMIALSRIC